MSGLPGIPWSPSEAASLNEFLNTPVGRKWLLVLLNRKPRIDLSSTEKAALSGAFAAGYESVFSEISFTRVGLPPSESASVRGIDPVRD